MLETLLFYTALLDSTARSTVLGPRSGCGYGRFYKSLFCSGLVWFGVVVLSPVDLLLHLLKYVYKSLPAMVEGLRIAVIALLLFSNEKHIIKQYVDGGEKDVYVC